MSGFMGREMGPGEDPLAQYTDVHCKLISVVHLIPTLRVLWKYHVLSLAGVLLGGGLAQFLLVSLSIGSFLKSNYHSSTCCQTSKNY